MIQPYLDDCFQNNMAREKREIGFSLASGLNMQMDQVELDGDSFGERLWKCAIIFAAG